MPEDLNEPDRLRWEKQLAEQAVAGDRAAFSEIYRAYAGRIFSRVLVPRLGDRTAAEDALAETFRSAYENLHRYTPKGSSLYFWLCRIAMNKATDMHRARATTGRALSSLGELLAPLRQGDPNPGEALEERTDIEQLTATVGRVLDELNPRYRRAIVLRFFDERPRDECAREMDVKLGTFDVLLLRALRAFRKQWEIVAHPEEEPSHAG